MVEEIERKKEAMLSSDYRYIFYNCDSNNFSEKIQYSKYEGTIKMYFVDRQKIEQYLTRLENNLNLYKEKEAWEDELSLLALERLTQSITDNVLDTSNVIIDGFIMRDPGSYEDIIDILLDERVITKEMEEQFKNVLPLRKMVVQEYLSMNHEELVQVLQENILAFEKFPQAVRGYLENELGPISAFKN